VGRRKPPRRIEELGVFRLRLQPFLRLTQRLVRHGSGQFTPHAQEPGIQATPQPAPELAVSRGVVPAGQQRPRIGRLDGGSPLLIAAQATPHLLQAVDVLGIG